MFYSPLRYPGGKNKLSPFIAQVCVDNGITGHYIEPYCGGASVALFLLFEKYVEKITINDKDKSIYALWHSILNDADNLCKLIYDSPINLDQWEKQKQIQLNKDSADYLSLGFSTLFLNRTNRSGIITGGMIGGRAQSGDYLIDCRFNKEDIIKKIVAISNLRNSIELYNMDAFSLIDFYDVAGSQNTIFYFDPPYYLKADQLYMNHYNINDHKAMSNRIKDIKNVHWIVSYDNHEIIRNLYYSFVNIEYSFTHSAGTSKIGNELLFFSDDLIQPRELNYNPVNYKLRMKKEGSKNIVYVKSTSTSPIVRI